MKRKIVWLIVSCLMVAALLLASCAPAVTEEEKPAAPAAPAPAEKEKEVVTPAPEEEEVVAPAEKGPKYGGVIRLALGAPLVGWDDTEDLALRHFRHAPSCRGAPWL